MLKKSVRWLTVLIVLFEASPVLCEHEWTQYFDTTSHIDKFYDICLHDEYLYASSDQGLLRVNTKTGQSSFFSSNGSLLRKLAPSPNGTIWIAGLKRLWKFDGALEESVPTGVLVSAMDTDQENNLWYFANSKLYVYDGKESTYKAESISVPNEVIATQDRIWVECSGSLWVYDDGNIVRFVSMSNSIHDYSKTSYY